MAHSGLGGCLRVLILGVAVVSVGCGSGPHGTTNNVKAVIGPAHKTTQETGSEGSPSSVTTTQVNLSVPTVASAPIPLATPGAMPTVVISATGVPLAVSGRSGDRYLVTTPCQRQVVIDGGVPVGAVDVIIDPGHGGALEDGAVGRAGLNEKDLNLAVARYMESDLARAGMHPLLTRVADYTMTVDARAEIVRHLRPKVFVSIHHNAEPDVASELPGTEAYYQQASPSSRRLAGLVWEEVTHALAPYGIPWMGRRDAGAKPRRGENGDDYYGILRLTHGTPATLAELAYITDPPEEALLARADVQHVEAAALARAVVRFVSSDDPGSGYVDPLPRPEPAGAGGVKSPACVDPRLE